MFATKLVTLSHILPKNILFGGGKSQVIFLICPKNSQDTIRDQCADFSEVFRFIT
jgi:hypothetical protein